MKPWILLIFLICIKVSCYAQSLELPPPETPTKKTEWKTILEKDYEVQYESNWDLDQTKSMGTEFILFAPLNKKEAQFRANINLMIQDISTKSWSLAEFTVFSENQVRTLMSESKILKNVAGNYNGSDYQNIVFTAKQSGRQLFFEQFYWVHKSKAFILTYTGNQTDFDSHLSLRHTMFESFKLHD